MSEVLHGSCLCGRIAYDVYDPESMIGCHCTRCQRWTGGSSSTTLVVEPKNLKVTKGQDLVRTFNEAGFAGRSFCGHCGSGLYVIGQDKLYVCAGTLKDVTKTMGCHIQVAFKAPWDEIGGTAPQFGEWPS